MKKLILGLVLLCLMAVFGSEVIATTHYEICDYYLSTWTRRVPHEVEVRTGVYIWLYDREDTTTKVDSVEVDSVGYFCFDVTAAGEYWVKADEKWYKKYQVAADSVVNGTVYMDTIHCGDQLHGVNEIKLGTSTLDQGTILITVQNKSGGTMHVGHPATAYTDTVELDDYQATTAATATCDDDLSDSSGYFWIAVLGHGTIAATDSIILWGESTEGAADADTFALTASNGNIAVSTYAFTTIDSFTIVNTLGGDSVRIYGVPYMMVTDAAASEYEFMGITYPDSIASDSTGTVAVFGVCLAKVDAATNDLVTPGELLYCKGSNMLDETTIDSLAVAIALQTADSSDDSVKVFIHKMGK